MRIATAPYREVGAAAAELGALDLEDAFELTLLLAAHGARRYGRAAVRWHARFCVERQRVELAEAELVLSLLAALPAQAKVAARGLEALFIERGERRLAEAVEALAGRDPNKPLIARHSAY